VGVFTCSILVVLLIQGSTSTVDLRADPSSAWLKEGIYAEYGFDSGSITFMNGSFFRFSRESRVRASFGWECVSVRQDSSRLNVTLSLRCEGSNCRFSTLLDVDFEERAVSLTDGTRVGLTFLWLPSKQELNHSLAIADRIIWKVTTLGLANTPQGLQEAFWVTGVGEVDGRTVVPGGGYDWDTGVLIESGFWGEPALIALGILDPGVVGVTQFASTNIDLGPGKMETESPGNLSLGMLLIGALSGFAAVTVVVLSARRRRPKKDC
jgi:hypothetical protein